MTLTANAKDGMLFLIGTVLTLALAFLVLLYKAAAETRTLNIEGAKAGTKNEKQQAAKWLPAVSSNLSDLGFEVRSWLTLGATFVALALWEANPAWGEAEPVRSLITLIGVGLAAVGARAIINPAPRRLSLASRNPSACSHHRRCRGSSAAEWRRRGRPTPWRDPCGARWLRSPNPWRHARRAAAEGDPEVADVRVLARRDAVTGHARQIGRSGSLGDAEPAGGGPPSAGVPSSTVGSSSIETTTNWTWVSLRAEMRDFHSPTALRTPARDP